MSKLEELKALGIDTESGIACCAEDEEFYIEMIEEYVREGRERIEALRETYGTQDWKNYSILAHSLKSTSRMIGAEHLSEQARELEFASRENETEKVNSMHEGMMKEYGKLLQDLEGILS